MQEQYFNHYIKKVYQYQVLHQQQQKEQVSILIKICLLKYTYFYFEVFIVRIDFESQFFKKNCDLNIFLF